jgi:HEAT repeat protein
LGRAIDSRAFSATGTLRTVVTARDKLIVDLADGTLERYDLTRDPREQRNLADDDPARARMLRAEVSAWESSHARIDGESQVSQSDEVLPDVLNRAIQGDRSVVSEVVALLGAGGFAARRSAAHVLGDMGHDAATVRDALARELGTRDAALVREAGLSLTLLGDPRGRDVARAALAAVEATDPVSLRAAVGLARTGDVSAVATLSAWVLRSDAADTQRDLAVDTLRTLNSPRAYETWVVLLGDARLAPRAAEALGALGDARALDVLRRALTTASYPLTARAIADALVTLRAPDAAARVGDALVVTDALPEAWSLMERVNEPGMHLAGARRAVTVRATQRGATLAFPVMRRTPWRRLYMQTTTTHDTTLTVIVGAARMTVAVPSGDHEVSVDVPAPTRASTVRVATTGVVTVRAVAAR